MCLRPGLVDGIERERLDRFDLVEVKGLHHGLAELLVEHIVRLQRQLEASHEEAQNHLATGMLDGSDILQVLLALPGTQPAVQSRLVLLDVAPEEQASLGRSVGAGVVVAALLVEHHRHLNAADLGRGRLETDTRTRPLAKEHERLALVLVDVTVAVVEELDPGSFGVALPLGVDHSHLGTRVSLGRPGVRRVTSRDAHLHVLADPTDRSALELIARGAVRMAAVANTVLVVRTRSTAGDLDELALLEELLELGLAGAGALEDFVGRVGRLVLGGPDGPGVDLLDHALCGLEVLDRRQQLEAGLDLLARATEAAGPLALELALLSGVGLRTSELALPALLVPLALTVELRLGALDSLGLERGGHVHLAVVDDEVAEVPQSHGDRAATLARGLLGLGLGRALLGHDLLRLGLSRSDTHGLGRLTRGHRLLLHRPDDASGRGSQGGTRTSSRRGTTHGRASLGRRHGPRLDDAAGVRVDAAPDGLDGAVGVTLAVQALLTLDALDEVVGGLREVSDHEHGDDLSGLQAHLGAHSVHLATGLAAQLVGDVHDGLLLREIGM